MTRRILLTLAPVALLLTGCNMDDAGSWGSSDRFKEDFHLSYPMKPGGTLSIDNFNGSIEIMSWEKDEVDVNGVKYAGSEVLLRQIKVEGEQQGNVLRLRTVRPEPKRGNCGAKYILRVPKKMLLNGIVSSNGSIRVENMVGDARLQSSNGSIRVRGLEGKLDAKTSNAGIEASTMRGDFLGHTSNGSIDLSLPDYTNQSIDADTSNSSIMLRLPAKTNAELRASSSNSSLSSDFEITANGATSKNRLEGRIGSGGATIRLSTSNGSVRVQKL